MDRNLETNRTYQQIQSSKEKKERKKKFSSENRHDNVVNDEIPSTSSQSMEQIEVVKEVVLLKVSNQNDPAMNKKQREPKTVLKKSRFKKKENGFAFVSPDSLLAITLIGGSSVYKIIDPSILQEIFSPVLKCLSSNVDKTLRVVIAQK